MRQSRSPEQARYSRDLSGLFLFAILAGIVIIVLALTSAMAQSSVEVRRLRAGVRDAPVAAHLMDRRARVYHDRRQAYFAAHGTKPIGR